MPEVLRPELNSATEAEMLGRIALMTAAQFTPTDIAQRLGMDMGIEIDESFVQILQVELGVIRNTPRVEVQRRLLAEGLSPEDAFRLACLIWDFPAKAGIQMAERGISYRQVLKELPRPTCQAVRAGYDLYRALKGEEGATFLVLQRLMGRAGVNEKELRALIPEAAPKVRGLSLQVRLPRGFRLTKEAS